MSISISNEVRREIVEAVTRQMEEHGVTNSNDLHPSIVAEEVYHVLADRSWVAVDDLGEAAEGLEPQFLDLAYDPY
jgi:hypothetical protein